MPLSYSPVDDNYATDAADGAANKEEYKELYITKSNNDHLQNPELVHGIDFVFAVKGFFLIVEEVAVDEPNHLEVED